jgi:PPOX class probable F420-dependent enzyme
MSNNAPTNADALAALRRYDELLRSTFFGMLSTIRHTDRLISTNPVGFVWDGESIRISTLKSRLKYRNVLANPLAAFCVISPKNPMSYVEVRGHAAVHDDPDRSFARLQFMTGSGGQEPPADMDAPHAERVIIQLLPHQVSSPKLYGGRFDDMAEGTK